VRVSIILGPMRRDRWFTAISPTHHESEGRTSLWATPSRLEPINDAARTVKRHWNGILRWFDFLSQSGPENRM
jgi:hypothetical protein